MSVSTCQICGARFLGQRALIYHHQAAHRHHDATLDEDERERLATSRAPAFVLPPDEPEKLPTWASVALVACLFVLAGALAVVARSLD